MIQPVSVHLAPSGGVYIVEEPDTYAEIMSVPHVVLHNATFTVVDGVAVATGDYWSSWEGKSPGDGSIVYRHLRHCRIDFECALVTCTGQLVHEVGTGCPITAQAAWAVLSIREDGQAVVWVKIPGRKEALKEHANTLNHKRRCLNEKDTWEAANYRLFDSLWHQFDMTTRELSEID